jgi:hypothetical protein
VGNSERFGGTLIGATLGGLTSYFLQRKSLAAKLAKGFAEEYRAAIGAETGDPPASQNSRYQYKS